ncbi:MAG TPA: NAD(P)(+) transhydrogenase (Re/Si-specific) subunit beta [Salinimicrobium sp.]|nr:NAD(P)(+) transhydrogenase (Re/Si-specific) subunit beta [Salinimicrobium sp.]
MTSLIGLGYLISTFSFLIGLKFMSSPKNAAKGNTIAAIGMILAVLVTIFTAFYENVPTINLIITGTAILAGTLLGKNISDKVEMTKMPQLISFFNATGGGCALILGLVEGSSLDISTGIVLKIVLVIGLLTGAIAFTGSILAYGKLAGKIKDIRTKSLVYTGRSILGLILLLPILYFLDFLPIEFSTLLYLMGGISLIYGILFVLPIGGADMPVVISLLNSITGVATAFAGFVYVNKVMIAGGIFVGAAGLLLTVLMCKAMNRSLLKVLAGTFKKGKNSVSESEQIIKTISTSETAMQLSYAKRVAIIPGYGLAVAQAQHICSQLQQLLERRDTEVHYIIHPVAGRMPGHMNVLLAEANIDYAVLKEMDEVNDHMDLYDMVLVIGANDVVNPAAENDEDSPVYGMPIIKAYKSQQVVVMKRGMSKGYAGVKNDLFDLNNCSLLFGDAKDSLQQIINQLKLV